MALEFRKETKQKNLTLVEKILDEMPGFVSDFIKDNETTKSDNTLLAYVRDIQQFFYYLTTSLSIGEIDLDLLNSLSMSDIKEYERSSLKSKDLSNSSIKRQLSTIASLYKYLVANKGLTNNPLHNYSYPKAESQGIVYLKSHQTRQLIDGVMSNTMKLVEKQSGKLDREGNHIMLQVPEEMSADEAILKEKNVLRDAAMITLFLGTGLRISELVGIDIEDLDFEENSVQVSRKGKGMSVEKVYFGKEVAEALKLYINGMDLNMNVVSKYPASFLNFCVNNAYKPNLIELACSNYSRNDSEFKDDVEQTCYIIRNFGRSNFKPNRGEDALFLSSRGTRISVRMVELIIKEKVLTYLPDMKNKDKISPHKLRSTAATRLLSQTDDILLVSKQLGHSSPTVTAKHYAQIQEEKEKLKLASLDISDW